MKMNADYRVDYILNKGDRIYTDHEIYTITGEPLGFGGSSILYPACRLGSNLEVAIKEWFPKLPANFERRHGIIQPKDPSDTVTLKENRKLFADELMMGEQVRNSTVRAIHLWGILKPTKLIIKGKEEAESDVSKGLFAVMERMDHKGKSFNQLLRYISEERSADSPLKTGGLPKIHTTALIMEQVLLALQRVHKAGENGYLFGDVQDGNIYFADAQLEQGDIGTGMLLDFGCTKPLTLKEDRKVYEYQGENIFSSQGYIPPEIAKPEAYKWELTDKADIYSTGCLMLRCLLSRAKIKTLGCTPYYRDDLVDEVDAANIGCSESNRRLVNSILENAMRLNPKERSSVDEMLEDIRKLITETAPPTYLLPKAPGSSESFVEGSRKKEISDIMQNLETNTPAFLWGCGGIGKSEIAIKVAKEFEKKSPKGSYFVHYTVPTNENQEAMEETVLRMPFEGYKYEPERSGMSLEEQRKADYRKRISILQKQYAGALLVIDNFDWPGKTLEDLMGEQSYLEMESIGLNLLFTTRNKVPGAPEVKELSREDLLKLMRRWVTDSRITDQQLYSLIEAVGGHTLTVDLIAKCLSRSRRKVTPEMMLECLQNRRLSEVKYPVTHRALVKGEDPERIGHRDPKTAQIYQHLKALFDLSGLDEQMKTILCYATLLPAGGMDCQLFESCLEEGHEQSFEYLLYCGWFRNSRDNVLSIHPIVREVCRNELVDIDKDRDNNLRFLNKLVLAAKKQCELGAGLEFANNKMRQVVIVCEELAQRIGIVYITEDTWKEINNLLKVMGNYHLIKQVKAVYPSIGQTRIPYAETDRTTGIRSFILDESNNIQYTVGLIGLNAGTEPIVKALATTTTISGNQQYQKVYITLDEMSEADCILIFAFHKDIQVMYRYIGYLSPMGVMLNLNPLRIPRVFIHNQGNDRKTMVRVVEFSVHEVYEDLFGGRTVEEVESTFQGKVLLINPDNAEKILLSGKEIKEGAQYYADFIFSKQDGISFMH